MVNAASSVCVNWYKLAQLPFEMFGRFNGFVRALKQAVSSSSSRVSPLGRGVTLPRLYLHTGQIKSDQQGLGLCGYLSATVNGSTIVDRSSCVTLEHSFNSDTGRYFDTTSFGSDVNNSFSKVSQDIFRQIASIAIKKAVREKKFFRFDASKILLQLEGPHTTVYVPEDQIVSDGEQTIYKDKIVGPVANLMFKLYNGVSSNNAGPYPYKELLDLLYLSQQHTQWWSSLEDLCGHPLLWSPEQRLSAIISGILRVDDGTTKIQHGIANATARTRNINNVDFQNALKQHDYYNIDYAWTRVEYNSTLEQYVEIKVSRSQATNKPHWTTMIPGCFGMHYSFGRKGDSDLIKRHRTISKS